MNGRLSVVVTCFNQGALIAPMLDDLLDDLRETDEVIVSDDGSTDDSVALIERVARTDRRVRVLPGAPSQSVSRTRNRGMQAATGEWIAFLDGDDEYCAGRRDLFTKGMQQFPSAQILFTDYVLWQPEATPPRETRALEARRIHDAMLRIAPTSVASSDAAPVWRSVDASELTLLLLQHGSVLHVCSLVLSRQWVETHALQFDSRLVVAEDTDFAIRALQGASVAFLPVVTARYRVSLTGLSARNDTAARMARVIQRVSNLQLPAAAPATRGELSAWLQVAHAELHLAYQCRQDGYYHTAIRHALRSFVAAPKRDAVSEILKSVWLIAKTGTREIHPVPSRPLEPASTLNSRDLSSLPMRSDADSDSVAPREIAAAGVSASDRHVRA